MTPPDSPPSPVFVGGTGRSGTTIVGQMIGHAAPYALVPTEIRCHTGGWINSRRGRRGVGGLADLALGQTTFDDFQASVRERWFYRKPKAKGRQGLHAIITREALDEALERLRAAHEQDPWQAAGDFLREILGQFATQAGKQTWVEMTPATARRMNALTRMLPEAKFIHMVRDGRDVAASVILQSWGPKNFPAALNWWSNELIDIEQARAEVAGERVLTMRLESLVGPTREDAYARLSDFLSLSSDTSMRTFFDTEISARGARADRWSASLEPAQVAEYQELYDNHLRRMKDSGAELAEPR